jgi:putative transcriptional regulator
MGKGKYPVSNVGKLRKDRGITQRELADLVGVTETTIRNWERDRSALECEPKDLITYMEVDTDAPF